VQDPPNGQGNSVYGDRRLRRVCRDYPRWVNSYGRPASPGEVTENQTFQAPIREADFTSI
jgi:hypothetical protein